MTGQTPRSFRSKPRPPVDREVVRHFVYFLNGADGRPVYIGRSCDVESRISAHRNNQGHPDPKQDTSSWFPRVDHAETVGPFAWDEAIRREREEIEAHQPPANRMFTARDHVPSRRPGAQESMAITQRAETTA